jgi:hypothetical protein
VKTVGRVAPPEIGRNRVGDKIQNPVEVATQSVDIPLKQFLGIPVSPRVHDLQEIEHTPWNLERSCSFGTLSPSFVTCHWSLYPPIQ